MRRVLVRGVGDVGSAVAHRLWTAGHAVVIHDGPWPAISRRRNAFTDAVFDGEAELEGVRAVFLPELAELEPCLARRAGVPVVTGDFDGRLALLLPDVLVDARMRKRERPECQRPLASLSIGLGPGFVAGEPRPILGYGRGRFVYAPAAGVFRTEHQIGAVVRAGEVIASLDALPLAAPLTGALRGLIHSGVPLAHSVKVIEVDPRGPDAVVPGIGERPGRIAEGVLAALQRPS